MLIPFLKGEPKKEKEYISFNDKNKVKISKLLGSGTYGKVYKVKVNNKNYAAKVMSSFSQVIDSSTMREVSSLITLNKNKNPFIVELLDIFKIENNQTSILLPLADGSFDELLYQDIYKLDIKNLGYQLASGLAFCHEHDIIHRDIKPQNILFYKLGKDKYHLLISDFGLSRSINCSYDTGRTDIVYTLYYRPPEVLLGCNYTDRADVWALGCIFAEMIERDTWFMIKEPYEAEDDENLHQLNTIIEIIGEPVDNVQQIKKYKEEYKVWPGRRNCQKWKDFEPYLYDNQGTNFNKLAKSHPGLFELLKKCFHYNPSRRISSYEILFDNYFSEEKENVIKEFKLKDQVFKSCKEKNKEKSPYTTLTKCWRISDVQSKEEKEISFEFFTQILDIYYNDYKRYGYKKRNYDSIFPSKRVIFHSLALADLILNYENVSVHREGSYSVISNGKEEWGVTEFLNCLIHLSWSFFDGYDTTNGIYEESFLSNYPRIFKDINRLRKIQAFILECISFDLNLTTPYDFLKEKERDDDKLTRKILESYLGNARLYYPPDVIANSFRTQKELLTEEEKFAITCMNKKAESQSVLEFLSERKK